MFDLAMSIAEVGASVEVCASALNSPELALCPVGVLTGSSFFPGVAAFGGTAPPPACVGKEVRDCCKFCACACEDVLSTWDAENWHAL